MVDPQIQRLLEHAIDSPVKLQLILMFHEHSRAEQTAPAIAERVCRDIWSVRQSLQDLTQAGLLAATGCVGGEDAYRYEPCSEWHEAIRRLVRGYNDPIERDLLQRAIRDLAAYATFRQPSADRFEFV